MPWNISGRKQNKMKTKACASCHNIKKISEFYVIKEKIDYYCKYCRIGHSMKSQIAKKDKNCKHCGIDKYYAKGYCRNCYSRNHRNGTPEIINYGREVYPNKDKRVNARKRQLKWRYDLTREQYEEMAKNGCHICGAEKLKHKELHVDHDHKHCDSSKSCGLCVRGILCDACNMAVLKYETGQMRDDYKNKEKIILYVSMHDALISDKIKQHDKKQRHR